MLVPIVLLSLTAALSALFFLRLRKGARKFYDDHRGARFRTSDKVLYLSDPYVGSKLRPLASFHLQREISGEYIHTNDRGERVAAPNTPATPHEILLTGDSFGLGVGTEYEDSVAGILESEYGYDIGNVALGNANLIQIVRRLEQSIPFHRPRLVIVLYKVNHIDRSFKLSGFLKGLGQRPVYAYHKKTKNLEIRENLWSPPCWIFQAIHASRKRLIDDHPFGWLDMWHYFRVRFLMRTIEKVRAAVKLFKNAHYKMVDEKKYQHRALRDHVLQDWISRLSELSRQHDFSVLFYQMFEPRSFKVHAEAIVGDLDTIQSIASNNPFFIVCDCAKEKAMFDTLLEEKGFPPEAYEDAFSLPDDFHWARPGNEVLARAVADAAAHHGLIADGRAVRHAPNSKPS